MNLKEEFEKKFVEYEICDNPDHSFIDGTPGDVGRLGCPCCGHNEEHRILNTAKIKSKPSEVWAWFESKLSQQREDTIKGLVDKIGLDCPNKNNCSNQGTLSEHDIHCDGSPDYCGSNCPVPVQCEFCYTNPLSKFNLQSKLEE